MHDTLDRKLRHLPTHPGVYLFKDAGGEILYIGKAKSLRARVRSHFAVDGATSLKNVEMLRRVADVDTIVVGSEAEVTLLAPALELVVDGFSDALASGRVEATMASHWIMDYRGEPIA